MKKRVLSLALALMMCLTLLPTTAWATETSENISEQPFADASCVCPVQDLIDTPPEENGITADNVGDGADEPMLLVDENAVTTFAGLQDAIINANGTKETPAVITISGSVSMTATLAINNKHIKLTGGTLTCSSLNAHMFTITNGGSLTLENIALDGTCHGTDQAEKANCNLVNIGAGELILNDGAILENNSDTAIYMNNGATLTMNGGEIRNNSDTRDSGCGAAIYTPDSVSDNARPTINIKGGKITGNSVGGNGGAIYLSSYCNLNITGGEITGNSAGGSGGAIYIRKYFTGNTDPISITGGTIKDNTAGEGRKGANIYTQRDIELGPDANIPSGIYLYYISGEASKLLLTGTPKNTVGLESLGANANWFSVVKMKGENDTVSKETFAKLTMVDPEQSLVLADDGIVHIGNPTSGDYPLNFTYTVWNGNFGSNTGIVGSQSGKGWTWDAGKRTLTITEDVQAIASGITMALSLPEDSKLVIGEGKTLTVESPDWYALHCRGALDISGKGIISTVSGDSYTGGILSGGTMTVSDTKLELTGTSNYFLYSEEDLSLENCEVSVHSKKSDVQPDSLDVYGITAYRNFSAKNCKIDVQLEIADTCTTSKKEANVCGIVAGTGYISLSGSNVKVNTKNSSPDTSAYNYSIVSYGGDISVTDGSQIIVTAAESTETLGIVGIREVTVDSSAVTVTATTSSKIEGAYALEMLSYGGFTLNDVEVIQGKELISGDHGTDDYEAVITQGIDTDGNASYTGTGGTSIIGPRVTNVALDKNTLDLTIGDSEALTAEIAPANAAIQDVTWFSSDETIATVDASGVVTALKAGIATITATADGETATCTVTVTKPTSGGGSSSGGTTTYPITTDDPPHGTVKADPQRAKEGTTVTLTVTPEEGYTIDDVTVTDQDGKEIPVTDQGDGKYTFPMPAGKVTVSASFTKGDTGYAHCPKDETCPIWPFTDASPTAWYHDGVHYCLDHGLMGGYPGSLFGPDDATTRGMIVTILYRLEGEPAASSSDFTDVPAGQYYTDAVAWAAANGIVNGYGDGAFGPEDPIAREQMAAILYRYAAYKEYDVTARGDLSGYTDADQISPYAMDAMAWVNGEGILAGTSATTLDPAGTTTRAQSATILMRCCVNVMK